ncbi:MAG: choice-of-anchor tandem repeat GloVer-containing protein [Caulobacteraceae bacterium]
MNFGIREWMIGTLAALDAIVAGTAARAGAPEALYNFKGGSDGAFPVGNLVADAAGNLFGVTLDGGISDRGVIFELSPPATQSGSWTEAVIYRFQGGADGQYPEGGLTIDSNGKIYGTTSGGGCLPDCDGFGYGTVFEITAPTGGSKNWAFSTIYRFQPKAGAQDGAGPEAALTFDTSGNLYGTTITGGLHFNGYGVVFKLAPPPSGSGLWTETLLHVFSGYSEGVRPLAGVTFDGAGNLFGTTTEGGLFGRCCGTVFELSPTKSGPWTDTILHRFNGRDGRGPGSDLVFDGSNNLFGAVSGGQGNGSICADGCGATFELTPPLGGVGDWSEQTIFRFPGGTAASNPGVVLFQNGILYGVARSFQPFSQGTLFVLSPSGRKFWNIVVTPFAGDEGAGPASLVTDPPVSGATTLYGVASKGGSTGRGTVFSWTP